MKSSSSNSDFEEEQYNFEDLFLYEDVLEEIESLVNSGTSINVRDENGNTLLHEAVRTNNLPVFDYLLTREEITINVINFYKETPLFLAVHNKNLNMAKRLIDSGADIFFSDEKYLHAAINKPAMCRLLIENGVNINATNYDRMSVLQKAVQRNRLETVCLLLYFNADANIPDISKLTPFHESLLEENVEIQKVLLDYVVDFNAETSTGESILRLAVDCKSPFVAEIIKSGAVVDSLDSRRVFKFILRENSNNLENLALIWSKLKGSVDMMSILLYLKKDNAEKFLDVIIESDNFVLAVDSFIKYKNLEDFIDDFFCLNLELDQLTKLICRLLSQGYQLTANDINKVYSRYGYCELFRIFLYTSSKNYSWRPEMIVPRLVFDFRSDVSEIMKKTILFNKETTEDVLRLTVNPVLVNAFLDRYGEKVLPKSFRLSTVPSLLELARNKARKHIGDVFNCQTSCQFYTVISYLEIPDDFKQILTFERKLYEL